MEAYVNITLRIMPCDSGAMDLRVPTGMTCKELLQTVLTAKGVPEQVHNPSGRNLEDGRPIAGTTRMGTLHNGASIVIDRL